MNYKPNAVLPKKNDDENSFLKNKKCILIKHFKDGKERIVEKKWLKEKKTNKKLLKKVNSEKNYIDSPT